jgi:hypothetical protein
MATEEERELELETPIPASIGAFTTRLHSVWVLGCARHATLGTASHNAYRSRNSPHPPKTNVPLFDLGTPPTSHAAVC